MAGTRTPGEIAPGQGRLLSVNVGAVRQIELAGKPRTTAIWKEPLSGRVAVRGVNVDGDDQADRRAHGGRTRPCTPTRGRTTPGGRRSSVKGSTREHSARTSPRKAST